MRFLHLGILLGLCALAVPSVEAEEPTPEKAEFFERHIRPLLTKRCLECHSTENGEIAGNLALDFRAGWESGGDSGPAIIPGKPDESLIIEAIRYESYEMPPEGKLPAEEIAMFEKWVSLGAPDPRNEARALPRAEIDFTAARQQWAYQSPEIHTVPDVQDKAWPLGPIDHFVLAKLEEAGLKPAAETDKRTWLRRVTFDLTGLPPTPEEIAAFLADESPEAFAKVVDRLLASPQFGEAWGRHWLDVARYSDSNGGDFNATYHEAYRYRDYVIESFNEDRPFDEFLRQQIAGDLLPYESDEERTENLVATGFLMIGPKMLSERDKEKLRMDVVDEQIDTVGKAFMGLTLGCARCHDHKFDPVPTQDYYALAGIFRSTVVLEGEFQRYVSKWPGQPLPEPAEVTARREAHTAKLSELKSQLAAAEKDLKLVESGVSKAIARQLGIVVDDTEAEKTGDWAASTYSKPFIGAGYIHDNKTSKGEKSLRYAAKMPEAGTYEIRFSFTASNGRDKAVPVVVHHGGQTTNLKVDQTKTPEHQGLFHTLGRFDYAEGEEAAVVISNAGTTDYVIADAVQFVSLDELDDKTDEPSAAKVELIDAAKKKVETLKAELAAHEKTAPPPRPQAFAVREADDIGDCHLCIRGEVHKRGDLVERGFLRVVDVAAPEVLPTDQSGRVQLANWMTHPRHPLTSRVIVNRIWQHMLGEGIVRTVDNFGKQGEEPSHPELLDTLAVQFVEQGWHIKPLVRQIALSRVYRLASAYDETSFLADPDNRLLWRAARKRLPAESIRDSLLAISGELDLTPSQAAMQGQGNYVDKSVGDPEAAKLQGDAAKRGVYLPLVRGEMPELLLVFDVADPELVVGRRSETNVPSQTLLLLNSPFVEARSKEIAKTLLADESLDTDARLNRLYELALARLPNDGERTRAQRYLDDTMENTKGEPQAAWTQLVQALVASTEFRMLD